MADTDTTNYTVQDLQDNLDYLDETKKQIKQAIIGKGQSVADTDTFRSYVQKINDIQVGVDTSDATATANDIISPKTAYVNEQKITGTLVLPPIDTQEYNACLDLTEQILGEEVTN